MRESASHMIKNTLNNALRRKMGTLSKHNLRACKIHCDRISWSPTVYLTCPLLLLRNTLRFKLINERIPLPIGKIGVVWQLKLQE